MFPFSDSIFQLGGRVTMSINEADTRYHLIAPALRATGYDSRDQVTLETVLTPPPVEPTGPKGRRRKGPGRTDYLLCVQLDGMPKSMPIAVLEAKKESDDPLRRRRGCSSRRDIGGNGRAPSAAEHCGKRGPSSRRARCGGSGPEDAVFSRDR